MAERRTDLEDAIINNTIGHSGAWKVAAWVAAIGALFAGCEVKHLRQQVEETDLIAREAQRRADVATEDAAEALRMIRALQP